MRKKKVAIYARVSTDGQTVENQLQALHEVAGRAGWEITGEYVDRGISGARGRDKRAAFDRLCRAAVRREFDLVAAWSVDRLGRSLQGLVGFLDELHGVDVGLYLHQQGIDTTTASGKALFGMCGVFAEFERSMIQERVKSGLDRARAQGKTLGRPKTAARVEQQIAELRRAGRGIRAIARELGIGVSVVQRVVKSRAG